MSLGAPFLRRRTVMCCCIALGLSATFACAQTRDYLNVPGPFSFGEDTYDLAWSARPSAKYFKQEYVPAGQQVETYTKMLLVDFLEGGITVNDVVTAQVAKIKARQGVDPLVHMAIARNGSTGEVLLDFLMSDKDKNGADIVEWDAYRYARAKNAEGKTGVELFGVSLRAYGNDNATAFLRQLKSLRSKQINILASAKLPLPTK